MFSRRPITAQNRGRVPSGGPGITPITILGAGLVQWCRADMGITVATGVSAWADQSGNGNDYAQGTGGLQPAYSASGGPNGQAYLTFDGSDDVLVSAGFNRPAPGTTNTWIAMILRQVSWTVNDELFAGNTSNAMTVFQSATTPRLRQNNGASGTENASLAVGTWGRLEVLYSNSASDYLKLIASSVTGVNTGNTASTGRVLGGAHVAGFYANFDCAEIIYFSGAGGPSAQQKDDLDAYFTARYGAGLV